MGGPAAGAAALSKMVYLALYNAACAAGWAYVLAQLGKGLAEGQGWAAIYQSIALVLQVVQTAAVLEIVHAATGLVRSAVFTTALQVGSRLLLVWQFLYACEECQDYYGMALACVSWSLVEIPRYLFYLVNLFGAEKVPDGLFWLRYSLFGILYPSGISGEILVMLKGLPWLQQVSWVKYQPQRRLIGVSHYGCSSFLSFLKERLEPATHCRYHHHSIHLYPGNTRLVHSRVALPLHAHAEGERCWCEVGG
jgi:very-long-chain (3R)-3-hydroxyacyl-CoA dehydratase